MSASLENPMVVGLDRYYAAQDLRDALAERAYITLRDELTDALMRDPTTAVQTPGWQERTTPAHEVISDSFSGATGEAALVELLSIVGLCASGRGDNEVHLRAAAWIAARVKEHAEFHATDLAEQLEGDAA